MVKRRCKGNIMARTKEGRALEWNYKVEEGGGAKQRTKDKEMQ